LIYLSLGSNIDNRGDYLNSAISMIKEKCKIIKQSSVHETKPVGFINQPNFLNMCICIETTLSPFELLHYCQDIEKQLGRVRTIKNGPRTIDIDILLFNNIVINTNHLIIPHPKMNERKFVLTPLSELM
jgi:2-amino-4-hydroxy-6-hydroxymethyldihydropteridine diphosphokinase